MINRPNTWVFLWKISRDIIFGGRLFRHLETVLELSFHGVHRHFFGVDEFVGIVLSLLELCKFRLGGLPSGC
jgi:hypothetical protein